ncbi:hypothetical protein BH20CHL7_BH20CHL7_13820 [soil metagenome]
MTNIAITGRRPGRWTFAAVLVAGLIAVEVVWLTTVVIAQNDIWTLGMDYRYYRDLGATWLAEGTFYQPYQLDGPYAFTNMLDVLYPPHALLLFVPAAILPAAIWWAIPIAGLLYGIRTVRPPRWTWLVMLVFLAWPRAIGAYLFGNTDIWVAAAIMAGAAWGWPAALLVLKPTTLPFALLAWRRRSLWIGLAAMGLFALLMRQEMGQYITAMRNLEIDPGYSLGSLPLYLVPVTAASGAWLERRRSRPLGGGS